jgi:aspartyl-tRNA(Asn)/glutamyl-tRNA(Gln) amidotransferase subunit A
LLDGVDTILIPGASMIAPKVTDVHNPKGESSNADNLLCIANFAGSPSISIPFKKVDGFPWGINLNCKQFKDQDLLNIAHTLEAILAGGAHE